MPVKILLLVHDLSDAAVHRRAVMLRAGGASVTVAGFRRTPEPVASVVGCPAIDFGRTYNEGFAQRIFAVVRETAFLSHHRALFADADIIVARNLEMLALAVRGRNLCRPPPVLVYECLDIHRLLLRRDFIGAALRRLEGRLARQASALITSSPAFVSGYFDSLSRVRLPVRLVIVAAAESAEVDDAEPVSAVFRFWVPVYVTVEDGKVTDVHVDDSAPARGYHDVQPDPDLIEGEGDDLLSAAVSAAFDGDQDWPAWEFGW